MHYRSQKTKHYLKCLLFGLFLTGIVPATIAQEVPPKVPTPTEFMAGNNRLFFQLVVKKKFSTESRFGFLTVASLSASYDNDREDWDMAVPMVLNYRVYKNFGIVAGGTMNNHVGFSPLVGIQHSYSSKKWVAVTIASLLLNSRNTELFGIYEFKPQLNPKINLYTRVQFLYVHNTQQNFHARSFLQLRTGLKINELSFGLGANLDQYGPEKIYKRNYGLFVGWAFQ